MTDLSAQQVRVWAQDKHQVGWNIPDLVGRACALSDSGCGDPAIGARRQHDARTLGHGNGPFGYDGYGRGDGGVCGVGGFGSGADFDDGNGRDAGTSYGDRGMYGGASSDGSRRTFPLESVWRI